MFSNRNEKKKKKKKKKKVMKKPVSLGLTILNTRKNVMYDFWYDDRKLKYGKKLNYVLWIQKPL